MHPNTLDVQPFCNSNLQSHSGTVSHCIIPYSKPFQNFKELASTGIKRIKILAAAGNPCAFNAFKTMIALVYFSAALRLVVWSWHTEVNDCGWTTLTRQLRLEVWHQLPKWPGRG